MFLIPSANKDFYVDFFLNKIHHSLINSFILFWKFWKQFKNRDETGSF